MQISRHWRLNSQRYRLQGVRYGNGEVSLQARPTPRNRSEVTTSNDETTIPSQEAGKLVDHPNGVTPETNPMHSLNGVGGGPENRG